LADARPGILNATDFSPVGAQAVSYAHTLAERLGAELHVLHVTDDISRAVSQKRSTGIFDPTDIIDESTRWLGKPLGETGTIRRVETI